MRALVVARYGHRAPSAAAVATAAAAAAADPFVACSSSSWRHRPSSSVSSLLSSISVSTSTAATSNARCVTVAPRYGLASMLRCVATSSTLTGSSSKQQQQQQQQQHTWIPTNGNVPVQSMEAPFQLTEDEHRTFEILKQVGRLHAPTTVLRIAGGWVRDKLLEHYQLHKQLPASVKYHAHPTLDIDVALSNMNGTKFAEYLTHFIEQQQSSSSSSSSSAPTPNGSDSSISSIGIVAARPDRSKHLETATLTLNNIQLDLVNLRSEVYSNTRIPTMSLGSAKEDASRRDFTLNSLFYNLHTGCIEDFTGLGIEDLLNGVLRTPSAAEETFSDDPLRILRAIRFAARFGFTLDHNIMTAAQLPHIKAALLRKVSLERIGIELRGMFAAPQYPVALRLIQQLGLRDVMLWVPSYSYDDERHIVPNHTQFTTHEQLSAATGRTTLANNNTTVAAIPTPSAAPSTSSRRDSQSTGSEEALINEYTSSSVWTDAQWHTAVTRATRLQSMLSYLPTLSSAARPLSPQASVQADIVLAAICSALCDDPEIYFAAKSATRSPKQYHWLDGLVVGRLRWSTSEYHHIMTVLNASHRVLIRDCPINISALAPSASSTSSTSVSNISEPSTSIVSHQVDMMYEELVWLRQVTPYETHAVALAISRCHTIEVSEFDTMFSYLAQKLNGSPVSLVFKRGNLLNGRDIQSLSSYRAAQIPPQIELTERWQLENPTADKEAALSWYRSLQQR